MAGQSEYESTYTTVAWQGGCRTSSEYHMTVWPLNCIPELIEFNKTAFICFHVVFRLGINPGSISIYHAMSIWKLVLTNF